MLNILEFKNEDEIWNNAANQKAYLSHRKTKENE